MRAARYRLRFVPGVSLSAATYGSSTYGGPITYGQRATDLLAAYRYRVVSLPAGYPTMPAWIFRHHDVSPAMRAQILSNAGPLDLSAVATAIAVLTPIDGRDDPAYVLTMTVDTPATNGMLTHTWTADDDLPTGNYRVVVVMTMQSTRRLALPTDDQLRLSVTEVPGG